MRFSVVKVQPQFYTEHENGVVEPQGKAASPALKNLDGEFDAPTADQIIVHLKLLHAINEHRLLISGTDGLFGYHNDAVLSFINHTEIDPEKKAELQQSLLQRIKEKRWAVYVTRAAIRFEAWWANTRKAKGEAPLTLKAMESKGFVQEALNSKRQKIVSGKEQLPPLDVLMVWHAFMLNPRCYLEDCLLHGFMGLWHTGLPWSAVDAAIDIESERYNPGNEAESTFESLTGSRWSNLDDPDNLALKCPNLSCKKSLPVPCTNIKSSEIDTWVADSVKRGSPVEFPSGCGYADSGFTAVCQNCKENLDHSRLSAKRFLDAYASNKYSLKSSRPMPGTILDRKGTISRLRDEYADEPRRFPIRLLWAMYFSKKEELRQSSTMEQVRDHIESALRDRGVVKYANLHHFGWKIPAQGRINIRRMMSRYWGNPSPFALDLVGAVVRQGCFIEKMENIDWLHSSDVYSTAERINSKYRLFFTLMSQRIPQLTVPTLDVDLVWHTHQLSPRSYYYFSTQNTPGHFVDHDDKIPETKLNSAFIETSQHFERLFKRPYSECLCWYCEAIRTAAEPLYLSMLFNRSTTTTEAEQALHDSSNPTPLTSDPEKGPHISAHNAIRPTTRNIGSRSNALYGEQLRKMGNNLKEAHERACKRAKRAGRPIPPKPASLQRYLDHEASRPNPGPPVLYPFFIVPVGFGPEGSPCDSNMYVSNPGCANLCPGGPGNCAAGSCGGAVAAGSCGTVPGGICVAEAGSNVPGGSGASGSCGSGGSSACSGCGAPAALGGGGDDGGGGCSGGCGGCGGCAGD